MARARALCVFNAHPRFKSLGPLLQLIGECFVKTAQTVLSSRVHEPQTAASKERSAKRTAWVGASNPTTHALSLTLALFLLLQFKLEIQEIDSAREALDRWRAERGVGLPLVLEVRGRSVKRATWAMHLSIFTF